MFSYHLVSEAEIPAEVRFDVPRANQGQIVEVAYGGPSGSRGEFGFGDPYRRITDRSIPGGRVKRVQYYVWREDSGASNRLPIRARGLR